MSKRAERRRRTAVVVARRKEVLRWTGLDLSFEREFGPFDQHMYSDWQIGQTWDKYCDVREASLFGRCRKINPLDCGNPKCGICRYHRREVRGITRQEIRFHDSADLQVAEFFNYD